MNNLSEILRGPSLRNDTLNDIRKRLKNIVKALDGEDLTTLPALSGVSSLGPKALDYTGKQICVLLDTIANKIKTRSTSSTITIKMNGTTYDVGDDGVVDLGEVFTPEVQEEILAENEIVSNEGLLDIFNS